MIATEIQETDMHAGCKKPVTVDNNWISSYHEEGGDGFSQKLSQSINKQLHYDDFSSFVNLSKAKKNLIIHGSYLPLQWQNATPTYFWPN